MKTIAWDVDDVLNDLMRSWLEEKWRKEHAACKVRYPDVAENPPDRLLGVSFDEYLASLDEYRLSPLYQQMGPVTEVMEWFAENGHKFRHIALTAVPLKAAFASSHWVFRHFGTWIRTFHFVPAKRRGEAIPQYDSDKGSFLSWISKVDILIDDSALNVKSAEKAGCKGILMPRPWNGNGRTIEETLAVLSAMA